MIAILHNIRSAHNVGSIFRTADAAGIEKLYLCGYTPSPRDGFGRMNEAIAKVALGAETYIPWAHAKSATKLIDALREQGVRVFVIEQAKEAVPYFALRASQVPSTHRIALVVGNEVRGFSRALLKRADTIIEIPMRGAVVRQAHHPRHTGRGKESLNVAVAFGIVAFHFAQILRSEKKYKGRH